MKSLEIKGGILNLIATIEDVETLKKLYGVVVDFIKKNDLDSDAVWEGIPDKIRKEIEIAFEESYDSANWVSDKEMQNQIKEWEKG